jgi:formylglycine-generating enzyme required for sulfatase activity
MALGMEREPGFSYPSGSEPYIPSPFRPAQYVVHRTVDEISIDGEIGEKSWAHADWTDTFGHIFLSAYRRPFLATRAKLLWDDRYLYAAAELEETNLVGHVTTRDEEIYRDNDIELFIDVDGDAQDYIELEFNCLGTIWDMFLPKEYNRGGLPHSHPRVATSPPWDLAGMLVAVRMDGSLNYPLDTDRGWTIEMALPWDSLQDTSRSSAQLNRPGTMLRLNFSRVQHTWPKVWPIIDWNDRGPRSYDWTWSQNLVYNMHSAECWGRVILSERTVRQPPEEHLQNAFGFQLPPAPTHTPEPGSMVRIPGGTYTIGPDLTDPHDSPQGSVTIEAFHLDCYAVTVGQYTCFLNDGDHAEHYSIDMANPDFCGIATCVGGGYESVPGRNLYPVTLITVEGALAYAAWAGKRLPTEFEWEAAARGLAARLYPWGDEPPTAVHANYDYHIGHPTPVGTYTAGSTPEGLFDMAGNVWELCDGSWRAYAWEGEIDTPRTAGQIMRGGSWVTPEPNMTATYRNGQKGVCPMVGFRCARNATE